MMHSPPPALSKKTQLPPVSRATVQEPCPRASVDERKSAPVTPSRLSPVVRTSSTTSGSAGTVQLSQHAPACLQRYSAWMSRQNADTLASSQASWVRAKRLSCRQKRHRNEAAHYKFEAKLLPAAPERSGSHSIWLGSIFAPCNSPHVRQRYLRPPTSQ